MGISHPKRAVARAHAGPGAKHCYLHMVQTISHARQVCWTSVWSSCGSGSSGSKHLRAALATAQRPEGKFAGKLGVRFEVLACFPGGSLAFARPLPGSR